MFMATVVQEDRVLHRTSDIYPLSLEDQNLANFPHSEPDKLLTDPTRLLSELFASQYISRDTL